MFLIISTLLVIFSTVTIAVNAHSCDEVIPTENGKITFQKEKTLYFVKCDTGYILHGKPLVNCINGQWESLPPKCVRRAQNACVTLPTPKNGLKECSERPLTLGAVCKFSCKDGYRLQGLTERRCMGDFMWNGKQPSCVPSSNNSCPVPPELKNGRVIGCSPSKVPTIGTACHFACNHGYVRRGPVSLICQASLKLTDERGNETFPECIVSVLNHSTDDDQPEDSRVKPIKPKPTQRQSERPRNRPNTTLRPRHQQQHSIWHKGSCKIQNGGCEHICSEQRNHNRCSCRDGYTLGTDGKSCVDVDECVKGNKCQQNCLNTVGGYTCSCHHGYQLIHNYTCEACRKGYFWQESENRCIGCPENSYTELEASTSIDECICMPGFIGDPKNSILCQDINECEPDNFGCSHKCTNTAGSAYCACEVGYTLDKDNKTCIDLDECSIKNGGCQGVCHNLIGSFYCTCPEGFKPSNKDQYSCDDIDECSQHNGGCEHKCHNHAGGYYCSCQDGQRLDSGRHNCTDSKCINPPIPHHLTMKCKKKKDKIEVADSYAVGTKCQFTCGKGFKISADSSKIECQEDGTWKGIIPECKPQQCPALPIPENGEVHPSSCATSGNFVKQKCTFTCRPGYILKTKPVYTCTNKLKWSFEENPECQPVKIQPTIKCPDDIIVELFPGQKTYYITLPAPETNVETVKIDPGWVHTNVPLAFPAGLTTVVFTAPVPDTKRFSRCETTINVVDKEAPVFTFCPSAIRKDNVGAYGVLVNWQDPLVTDNVNVTSVEYTMRNNSTLTPGTYMVEYTARDAAGNSASCTFDIVINRIQCNDIADPLHGRANCMDFTSGKLCQPECEDGYIRHPSEPDTFSCGESGTWEPSYRISDCLRYELPGPTGCPDGYELDENIETEEFICIVIVQ